MSLLIILDAFALVALIAIVLAFLVYNNLIRLRNNVTRAWSNVDVLLEKRHDLISNLIVVVKEYEQYEKTLLFQLTQIRDSWNAVKDNGDISSKIETSSSISGSMKTLFADVENYPDLKANTTFTELQKALVEVENEIADSRQFYNDSIKLYNTNIAVVPYSLFANVLHYAPMPYFGVLESDKGNVVL